jgi:TnpA family transposase
VRLFTFRTDVRKIAHPTDKSNAKALVEGFEHLLGLQYWQADRDEREKKWMQC